MNIKFKKLVETAKIPAYAHHDDAGMDVYTIEEYTLKPGEQHLFKTGISSELATGYVILFWDKSGVGAKGVKSLGGVVDAGYRGEWLVMLRNLSDQAVTFKAGDKIIQALIQKVEHPEIIEIDQLSETARGDGGFGSTGHN